MQTFVGLTLALALVTSPLLAHPVTKEGHDRTIAVRLRQVDPQTLQLHVEYRLDVEELQVLKDMERFRPVLRYEDFVGRFPEFYRQFAAAHANDLAERLDARVNGASLVFTCASQQTTLWDEKKQPLGHLRCDFTFQATMPAAGNVSFRDGTYEAEAGFVDLTFVNDSPLSITNWIGPSETLLKKPRPDLTEAERERMRELKFRFEPTPAPNDPPPEVSSESFGPGILEVCLLCGLAVLAILANRRRRR